MANKPRRKSLRDRICAIFGIRRQPRLISLFTEDLPQDHMQLMDEPQYLSYLHSLDSHPESGLSPSTSKSSKEYNQLGPQTDIHSTGNLHKSSSVMSLHHWTSTAMSPLELFYCATVAPYDVDRISESQAFHEERPGRACCNRRMDATTSSLRNIKSDLACPSRYLVPFDNSTRGLVNDPPIKIGQSKHDKTVLESGEACFRTSMNNAKRSPVESYRMPVYKEQPFNLGDVETRSSAESMSHKARVRLSALKDVCPENNRCKERREEPDVAIRLCDNQVELTLKESCKHVVIRFKDAIQKSASHDDCSNTDRRELGNKEELIRVNKDRVAISIAGDCVKVSIHVDTGDRLLYDGPQSDTNSKSSSEFNASGVRDGQYADQCPDMKQDDSNEGCVKTSKGVQTNTVDSEGARITSVVFSLQQVLTTFENKDMDAEDDDLSVQTGRSQMVLVDEQDKDANVANGVVTGVANGVVNGVASGVVNAGASGVVNVGASGVVTGVASGVVNVGASGVVTGVASGVVNGVASGVVNVGASEVVTGVASGVVTGIASGVVNGFVNGVVNRQTNAKNNFIPLHTCRDEPAIETVESAKKYDEDNEEDKDVCDGSFGDVTAGCQDNFEGGHCRPKVPSKGDSADGVTDKRRSREDVVGNVMKLEDVVVSVRQVPDVGQGASNIDERGAVLHPKSPNHTEDKERERSLVDRHAVCLVDDTGMVDVFLLMQIPDWSSQPRETTVLKCTTGGLQLDLRQLAGELAECRRQLGHVNTCLSALRQEVTGARFSLSSVCQLTAISNMESSYLRTLEPTCYKKYHHIHTRADAKYTLGLVRNHIKALNDLEVLIYRKHLILLQVLHCDHQEQIPQAKRGGMFTNKVLKAKRRERTDNSQEPIDSVIIEIVSVAAKINSCSNETSSRESPANISTLLSLSSEGGASSQYLTDTEI